MVQIIEIESYIKNIDQVEIFLNDRLKDCNILRKTYCRLYLAVIEAVSNAIVHGNKKIIDKKVKVTFDDCHDLYKIIINDEGDGFDYNSVPDPRSEENINKESGRGIFIIKQYADKVLFNNNGSEIILIFNK